MTEPTLKQMYNFCKAHYYTDDETLWEPFEYYSEDQVEQFIDGDVIALADFLGIEFAHTDYLEMKAKK